MGTGMLVMPVDAVKIAKQDAWIAMILRSVYAVYSLSLSNFLAKKYPEDNVLTLSKMCFGRFIGNLLNFIFVTNFIAVGIAVASGASNVLRAYMTYYLTNEKILITFFLIPAFVAFKGLKTLGRMNEILFYLTLPVFLIPITVLNTGSIRNVMPFFGSGIINILKASKDNFNYFGSDVIFLLYPFLNDKNKMKYCTVIGILVPIIVYTWFAFITIYYLNIYTVTKFIWPVLTVSENVTIAFINSFRFITISLWLLIGIKISTIHYYSAAFGLSEITKKLTSQQLAYILFPIFFFLSTLFGPPTVRGKLTDIMLSFYLLFNIVYISIIAIIIYFKKGDKNDA